MPHVKSLERAENRKKVNKKKKEFKNMLNDALKFYRQKFTEDGVPPKAVDMVDEFPWVCNERRVELLVLYGRTNVEPAYEPMGDYEHLAERTWGLNYDVLHEAKWKLYTGEISCLTAAVVRDIALSINEKRNYLEVFSASTSWINRWKRIYNISLPTCSLERICEPKIEPEEIELTKENTFQIINQMFAVYVPDDIYEESM